MTTPTFSLRPLAASDADAALPALTDLLRASVAGGASIGWPTEPGEPVAQAFWRGCFDAVALGGRELWVALERADDIGSLIGTAQLAAAGMPNGRHRAEVMKVMVHPRARRRGVAEALMRRLEALARQQGRRLLVLDTLSGSDAERLYRRLGWQRSGRIPAYAELGDGRLESTTVMFKRLFDGGLSVVPASPDDDEARALMQALSARLLDLHGSSGEAGFAGFDLATGAFALARDAQGRAVGCGALRPLPQRGPRCAELKRMFAAQSRRGVGLAVLRHLEHEAEVLGFDEVALSTRRANSVALAFYAAAGYREVPPWSPYATRPESICLARRLQPVPCGP